MIQRLFRFFGKPSERHGLAAGLGYNYAERGTATGITMVKGVQGINGIPQHKECHYSYFFYLGFFYLFQVSEVLANLQLKRSAIP